MNPVFASITLSGIPALVTFLAFLFAPFMLLAIIAGIARRIHERRLKRNTSTIIAQYEPPLGLRPAEVGFLYDMKCGSKEVYATLFDLEMRKIIQTTEQHTVSIINQQAYEQLKEFEKIAIKLYSGGTAVSFDTHAGLEGKIPSIQAILTQITTLKLENTTLVGFTLAVRASLRSQGFPTKSYVLSVLLRSLLPTLVMSLWALWIILFIAIQQGISLSSEAIAMTLLVSIAFSIPLFPLYYGIGIVATLLWVKVAGRYWLYSKKTRALWRSLEGYKLFLEQTDLSMIQFESATARDGSPTVKTFPYAIALNLDTQWKKRLPQKPRPQ